MCFRIARGTSTSISGSSARLSCPEPDAKRRCRTGRGTNGPPTCCPKMIRRGPGRGSFIRCERIGRARGRKESLAHFQSVFLVPPGDGFLGIFAVMLVRAALGDVGPRRGIVEHELYVLLWLGQW